MKSVDRFFSFFTEIDLRTYQWVLNDSNEALAEKLLDGTNSSEMVIRNIRFNGLNIGAYYRSLLELSSLLIKDYKRRKKDNKEIFALIESLKNKNAIQLFEYNGKKYQQNEILKYFENSELKSIIKSLTHLEELVDEVIESTIKGLKKLTKPLDLLRPAAEEIQTPRHVAKAFCWNKNRNRTEDMVKLHTFFREYGYIDKETSISQLDDAFNCSYIVEPLRIKWIKTVKGKATKTLIFHLIDELERLRLIQLTPQNSVLFNTIRGIFVNHLGAEFKNLAVSKSTWLNQRVNHRTPQELELDLIISTVAH